MRPTAGCRFFRKTDSVCESGATRVSSPSVAIRSASLVGRPGRHDLLIGSGRITSVVPCGSTSTSRRTPTPTPTDGLTELDVAGRLVIPGLINAHCHLDKTLWGLDVPYAAGRRVPQLIRDERMSRDRFGVPDVSRITALLLVMSSFGTTHVRTHTDIDPSVGLRGVTAVAEAATAVADRITVEQVAFPQSGIVTQPGTDDLMQAALRMGVGTVGGLDPAGIDDDPVAHLDAVFRLADVHSARIDIHLHDDGSLGLWQLRLIAERTRALSLEGRVVVSHAFALGSAGESDQDRAIELLRDAGIAVHTAARFADPIPPVGKLHAAGVPLGLGTDGVRDLWSPFGSGDVLERCAALASRSGFATDADVERCLAAATTNAARTLGLPDHGLAAGASADLVVIDGGTLTRAVLDHPPRHLVMKGGRILQPDAD